MTPLNPGDLWVVAPVEAAYCLGVNDLGAVAWTPNRPEPSRVRWLYEPGARNAAGHFISASGGTGGLAFTVGADGAHSPSTALTVASATSTGSISVLNGDGGAVCDFNTTSGAFQYDATITVKNVDSVLTLLWTLEIGFTDGQGTASVDSACISILDGAQANFQCTAKSNSTATTTDSGVAVTAGTAYRVRVVVTNASTVQFWIVADSTSSTNLGSPTVTITTNIPTGTARATDVGMNGFSDATTVTAATVNYTYQRAAQTPINAVVASGGGLADNCLNPGDGLGLGLGYQGQELNLSEAGVAQWGERYPSVVAIPWQAWDASDSVDFGSDTSGTGATVTVPTTAPISGQPPDWVLSTGTAAAGWAARSIPNQSMTACVAFDTTTGTYVYEALFQVPTLTVSGETFSACVGFMATASIAPGNSAFIILPSTAGSAFVCHTSKSSTATTTTTSITAVAGTYYYARIVVTNATSISYYLAALGSNWTTPVATHTTNIPNGTGFAVVPTAAAISATGTTAKTVRVSMQNVYMRRTP